MRFYHLIDVIIYNKDIKNIYNITLTTHFSHVAYDCPINK